MIVPISPMFAQLVQDFFCTHLVSQRNASACTIRSYRDTFRLFLRFLEDELGKQPSKVDLSDLTPATIEAFLSHLESSRGNAIRTRNNRFAAIRSFLKRRTAGKMLAAEGTDRAMDWFVKGQVDNVSDEAIEYLQTHTL